MEAAFKVGAASSLRGWPCCSHLHLDGQGADMAWLGFGRMNLTEGGKERKTFPRSMRRLTSQEECMNHQLNSNVSPNLRNCVSTFEKHKRFAINAKCCQSIFPVNSGPT